jgi:hypothetical protein
MFVHSIHLALPLGVGMTSTAEPGDYGEAVHWRDGSVLSDDPETQRSAGLRER